MAAFLTVSLAVGILGGCGQTAADTADAKKVEITNVSYDPTRDCTRRTMRCLRNTGRSRSGQDVSVIQSHGGSGKQALEVANGLEADVVTLALEGDVQVVADAD